MLPDDLKDLLLRTYLGNTVGAYLAALGVLFSSFLLLFTVGKVALRRLERWAAGTATNLDDLFVEVVREGFLPLLTAGSIYASLRGLHVHASLAAAVRVAWMACATFFGVRMAVALAAYMLHERAARTGQAQAANVLIPVLKAALWGMGLIFFLDNMGVKVSAVVAGLGIGGVAVALAAQAVLGDLFSHFAILFDRPFALGDFIVVDDLKGNVEHIGIKTTRVRSLSGEVLVFPNSSLTGSRIRNYQALRERRVQFTLGLTYETPAQKLKEVPALLKEIITGTPGTRFDRAHFAAFAESSLDFEAVYFMLSGDYNKHMDAQQEINFKILAEMQKRGISFAYPTRTVYSAPAAR